jgi:hypothetical protein
VDAYRQGVIKVLSPSGFFERLGVSQSGIPDTQFLAFAPKIALGDTTVMSRGTPRPIKIEFARQPIILQMASKKNGDTTDAWRSQAVSATSTQWWGKRLTISSIGRTDCGVCHPRGRHRRAEGGDSTPVPRVVGGVSRCGRFPLSRAIHAYVPPRRGLLPGCVDSRRCRSATPL